MRILLTVHQFLPDHHGGTEVLTHQIARFLLDRGHEVRVLTGWPEARPPLPERYVFDGIDVDRMPSMSTTGIAPATVVRDEFDSPRVEDRFADLVATWHPDVVHCVHLQRLSASIVRRCRNLRIPIVYTPTDFWWECPLNQLRLPDGSACDGPRADAANCVLHLAVQGTKASRAPLFRWIPEAPVGALLDSTLLSAPRHRRMAAARALQERRSAMRDMLVSFHRILAPTRWMADRIRAFADVGDRIVLQRFGIDQGAFAAVEPNCRSEVLRFGFIGSLEEHKGAHVLVDAVRMLPPDAACKVLIYGAPITTNRYHADLLEAAGSDPRIEFRGVFPPAELGRVIEQIDVLIAPSTWAENTPLVVLAAQAGRRMILGSRVPGISEVVEDGVDGLLVQAGHAAEFAHAMQRLIDHPSDVVRMSRSAIPPKTIDAYGVELIEIYTQVIGECDGDNHERAGSGRAVGR